MVDEIESITILVEADESITETDGGAGEGVGREGMTKTGVEGKDEVADEREGENGVVGEGKGAPSGTPLCWVIPITERTGMISATRSRAISTGVETSALLLTIPRVDQFPVR